MGRTLKSSLSRFSRREDGVALVEFAIFLPLFLLSFFVIVEFSRVFLSYQGAVAGVRDAARYMARIAPANICVDDSVLGGPLFGPEYDNPPDPNIPASNFAPFHIIWRNIDNEIAALPAYIDLLNVSATFECVEDTSIALRQARVPIVIVSADIEITLPLIGILELNGGIIPFGKITRKVIDESRIFGV